MTKEIKEKWIEALESGTYIQGTGSLRKRESIIKHCCLGVLGEICGLKILPNGITFSPVNFDYADGDAFYPHLSHILSKTHQQKLVNLNDTLRSDMAKDYTNVISYIKQLETID